MSREAATKDRGIAVLLRKDAEFDGRPSLNIGHHPEFDYLQPEALHIGQQLRRGRQRIGGEGPRLAGFGIGYSPRRESYQWTGR